MGVWAKTWVMVTPWQYTTVRPNRDVSLLCSITCASMAKSATIIHRKYPSIVSDLLQDSEEQKTHYAK